MNLNYFNERMDSLFKQYPEGKLKEAMLYALKNGGKRIRPRLFIAVLESYGVKAEAYYDIAIALEMIHTYSLVHDDLPAMDDDALRRGMPTVHIAFDEATAILAGDALLTEAFSLISKHKDLPSHVLVKLVEILALKAGANGMVYGQMLDLEAEGKIIDLESIKAIHLNKTARLIEASLMMGAIISNSEDIETWEKIGHLLGFAFQLQDDVLEVTSNEMVMGKSLSDADQNKSTIVKLLGLDQSLKLIEDMFLEVHKHLEKLTIHVEVIEPLILAVKNRNK